MTRASADIMSLDVLSTVVPEAWDQWYRLGSKGSYFETIGDLAETLKNRYLRYAQAVYLEAILFAVQSGGGSRGSAFVLKKDGIPIHQDLGDQWRFEPENPAFRKMVLKTIVKEDRKVDNRWVDRSPLPRTEAWFETTWASYQKGEIYQK